MSSYSATAATRRGSVVPPLSGIDRPVLQPLPDSCDVLIAGTGLVESILAAALAWQGSRVIHIDHNPYYGDASSILGIEQLQDWVNHVNSSKDSIYSNALLYIPRPIPSRKYFIDLTPKILFAQSDLLPILVKSRINRYLEFKPISSFHTYENDSFDRVPASKQAIFTDQSLSLITKRSLMRFMKFVIDYQNTSPPSPTAKSNAALWKPYAHKPIASFIKDLFGLQDQQITELVYSIGLASHPDISTINALPRMKRYLVSLGVYGNFPALYSTYGSAGELVQAFSRSAAVAGATYKLSTHVRSCENLDGQLMVSLSDGSKVKVAEHMVLSSNTVLDVVRSGPALGSGSEGSGSESISGSLNPSTSSTTTSSTTTPTTTTPTTTTPTSSTTTTPTTTTRLVAIVAKDCHEWFSDGEQSAVVVFPPHTLASNNSYAVQTIIMGSGSGQCPHGHSIWYISTLGSSRDHLEAALEKLEASILRESTEAFQFNNIASSDVSLRPDGTPVLSSLKLGQSLQSFVPKERLQYLVKFCYTQQLGPVAHAASALSSAWHLPVDPALVASDAKISVAPCPLAEISYDGVVDQAIHLYEKIVGSDDDFFDLDFDDEDEPYTRVPQKVAYSDSAIVSDDEEDTMPDFGDDMDL